MSRIVVVSPHLDDGVFGTGDMLAVQKNSKLLTIFSGIPNGVNPTSYDKYTGFKSSQDAMVTRREEDKEAAATLNADVAHLDFLDKQYNSTPTRESLLEALEKELADADVIYLPLGMQHQDHIDTRNALLEYRDKHLDKAYYVYEEMPYRIIYPDYAKTVLDHLRGVFDLKLEFMQPHKLSNKKIFAVSRYKSQMYTGDISPYTVLAPERHWRILND